MMPCRSIQRPAPTAVGRQIALILPACHEEETIEAVLNELRDKLDSRWEWVVAVGVNGSPVGEDRTADLARRHPLRPVIAETPARGYGFGWHAAIIRLVEMGVTPDAFIFFAADGANDPTDFSRLLAAYEQGSDFVLGCRTAPWRHGNLAVMGWSHLLANRLLGAWCGLLTRRWFHDIGPLRLIERGLFHRLGLREWTFGWTIEAQVFAARLDAVMSEVPVRERRRLAGQQKVSKVSYGRTLSIGWQIALAGWRAKRRSIPSAQRNVPLVASSEHSPSALSNTADAR